MKHLSGIIPSPSRFSRLGSETNVFPTHAERRGDVVKSDHVAGYGCDDIDVLPTSEHLEQYAMGVNGAVTDYRLGLRFNIARRIGARIVAVSNLARKVWR